MYIDAKTIQNEEEGTELVYVSQRDKDGVRSITSHLPPYEFYYISKNGSHESIFGDPLKKKRFTDRRKFYWQRKKMKEEGYELFESDIKPHFRLLEERFPTDDAPKLHVSFIDIEADRDPKIGFPKVSNPYSLINAITIHNDWEGISYTIAVPPPNLTMEEARALLDQEEHEDGFGPMTEDDNYFLVENESILLLKTIELIQGADVITGWNSSFFDLPYIIQRIRIVLGGEDIRKINREKARDHFKPSERSKKHLERLNLFPCLPEMRVVEKFGKFEKTFDIFGRIHLDYLDLYKKFTFEELHQYKLDFVLQKEVKEGKVPLTEDLDRVYRNTLRTFLAYNRQDVDGMVKLDKKRKMIQLANNTAHMAGVTLDKTLGTVTITEQAILRRLHRKGQICFDKTDHIDTGTIPGAFVVKPIGGMYDWVFSVDINSLYPSVIRAINISPEVVIGQFDLAETEEEWQRLFVMYGGDKATSDQRKREAGAKAWGHFTGVLEYHHIVDETDDVLTLYLEGTDETVSATAKEWKHLIRENGWSVSGNGTVFTLEREGIVSECMADWYRERKEFQAKKKAADPGSEEETYWDMIQQVRKIFLNATYGAYLNTAFRFFDPRLGRSVTLTGRCITKHMIREGCRIMTGDYDFNRDAIIYGDTDSAYLTMVKYMKDKGVRAHLDNAEEIVKIADDLGEDINKSFPSFMDREFLIGEERGEIIRAGREVVADRGLFGDNVKKRYALHVIDNEGRTSDKMKVMGMETRRSDTPKYIQVFLQERLTDAIRDGKSFDEIRQSVDEYRENVFRKMDPWKRGRPCQVSNLTVNTKKMENYDSKVAQGYIDIEKPSTHFSVKAANNTNHLMEVFGESHWDFLNDGDKIEILDLCDNPFEIESVAIRSGEVVIPNWFKDLPFDNAAHERKLITKKMNNIFGSLGWDFEPINDYRDEVFGDEEDFFSDVEVDPDDLPRYL